MADENDSAATTEGGEATTDDGITPQRPDKAREETHLAADTDIEAQQQPRTKVCLPSNWHGLALAHSLLISKALMTVGNQASLPTRDTAVSALARVQAVLAMFGSLLQFCTC
jgi:hypothetical protein